MNSASEKEFVDLLMTNQNILHKICRLYAYDDEEHKDLFQEMTIQLWKAYPNFRGDSKFSTWAYRVALNTAITLFRKKSRSVDTTSINNLMFQFKSDEYSSEQEDQLKLMYQAVYQLSDIDKALVYMYLENKDYAEISETLGISEVNSRVKMNRIKKKLKEILNP